MNLPRDVVIAEEKLIGYLLVWRARNDKSGYLARAGYESSNWEAWKPLSGNWHGRRKRSPRDIMLSARFYPHAGSFMVPTALY